MKKGLLTIFFLIAFFGFKYPQEVKVNDPKGPYYFIGDTMVVSWVYDQRIEYEDPISGGSKKVKVKLFKSDNSVEYMMKDNFPYKDRSFSYMIPNTVRPGRYYVKVKIKDYPIDGLSPVFVIASRKPDLVVNKVSTTPGTAYVGDKVTFRITVDNSGKNPAPASRAKITIFGPTGSGFQTKTAYLPVRRLIGFGDHVYLNYDYVASKVGTYRNRVELDVDHVVNEDNVTNNKKDRISTALPAPDLIVCLTCGKRPWMCKDTTITAWVKNIGSAASPPCLLHISVKERGETPHNIPRLEPNQVYGPITRTAKYCKNFGSKTMSATIDKDNEVKELNEDNNYVKTTYFVRSSSLQDKYGTCSCTNTYKAAYELNVPEVTQGACCSIKKNQ